MPTKNQALIYTAVSHYLKAVDKAGTDEAVAANAAMRSLPVAFFDHPASLRADAPALRPRALPAKEPAASKGPWDLYEVLRTIPKEEAFLPMNPACAPNGAGRRGW